MANLIIKSTANDLVIQGSDASPAITVGATGTTTFAENATLSGTANNLGTVTAGTYNSTIGTLATFPAGHILQDKVFRSGGETNTLNDTYTNYYEVSIVLKSATSHVNLCLHTVCYTTNDNGMGCIFYRKASGSGVANSDVNVGPAQLADSGGPHSNYSSAGGAMYWDVNRITTDTFSDITQTLGQTIYYSPLARGYNTTGAVCPVSATYKPEWVVRVTEVQQ